MTKDLDQQELDEWQEALRAVAHFSGAQRAREVLDDLAAVAQTAPIDWQPKQARLILTRSRLRLRSRFQVTWRLKSA